MKKMTTKAGNDTNASAEEIETPKTMILVEKHIIRPSNPYFEMLKESCHLSKNLYNHGLYIARQTFISDGSWARYAQLEAETRKNIEFPDYKAMPTAQMAQQTLRILDANLASFFKAIKAWKKNKSKFTGRPKLPHYLPKDGHFAAVVTNQNARLKKDGLIHFPKSFNGFTVEPQFPQKYTNAKFQQARITFDGVNVYVEIIYRIPAPKPTKDNGRHMAIDIGVTNLAACVTNTGAVPLIFRGGHCESHQPILQQGTRQQEKLSRQAQQAQEFQIHRAAFEEAEPQDERPDAQSRAQNRRRVRVAEHQRHRDRQEQRVESRPENVEVLEPEIRANPFG